MESDGKLALVTGASSGIGEVLVHGAPVVRDGRDPGRILRRRAA